MKNTACVLLFVSIIGACKKPDSAETSVVNSSNAESKLQYSFQAKEGVFTFPETTLRQIKQKWVQNLEIRSTMSASYIALINQCKRNFSNACFEEFNLKTQGSSTAGLYEVGATAPVCYIHTTGPNAIWAYTAETMSNGRTRIRGFVSTGANNCVNATIQQMMENRQGSSFEIVTNEFIRSSIQSQSQNSSSDNEITEQDFEDLNNSPNSSESTDEDPKFTDEDFK